VNNVRNDGPELFEPITPEPPAPEPQGRLFDEVLGS
jgi:hypothetical protein